MPKLDEEDFVDPGNLPSITQSRTPPPPGGSAMPNMGSSMGGMAAGMMGNMGGGMMGGQMQQPMANSTAAGENAAQNAEILVKNTNEDFINKKWRPMMGWTYMATCIFDFILAPILWAVVQFWETEAANDAFRQWQPLTLQGAGLYHMAMGAVLGIAAYGRTKEKIESKQ